MIDRYARRAILFAVLAIALILWLVAGAPVWVAALVAGVGIIMLAGLVGIALLILLGSELAE